MKNMKRYHSMRLVRTAAATLLTPFAMRSAGIKRLGLAACCAAMALGVQAQNAPPTIANIGDQSTFEDQPTEPILVAINDTNTPAKTLQLSGFSSNQSLVADTNIFFYDYDFANHVNRSVSLTPTFGQTGTSTITVIVSDGTSTATNSFLFTVNPPPSGSVRFANPTPITIPTQGMATPYGSDIVVSNVVGNITKLEVTFSQFSHDYPGDVDMLLVSPSGKKMVVYSRAGDSGTNSDFTAGATNITITFSDSAVFSLPFPYPLISIPFTPGDYSTSIPPAAAFPTPAPQGPYNTPVAMSNFNGDSPNGTWSLYVYDFMPPDGGVIAGGWSMMLHTASAPTISNITNQTATVNTAVGQIPFTIYDGQTAASNLVLSVTSSDQTLVPTNNIVFGGSDSNRTVTIVPVSNHLGTATITITVQDEDSMTASSSFDLTIDPAALTLTVDSVSRAYGDTNPPLTGSIIGVQPGDDITLSLDTAATPASPADIYPIVPTLNDPNARLGNYIIVTNSGTLTVTQASLTITASDAIKVYGQTASFAGTEYTSLGLVNGDLITNVSLSSSGAAATAPAVGYAIVPADAAGTGLSNYTIVYVNGTLTVNPAGLTVTANPTNKIYGDIDGLLTYRVTSGALVNGDGFVGSLSRANGETVSIYPIQQGSLTAGTNYALSYVGANFRITKRSLTIKGDNKSRAYGLANPPFTVTYTTLVNGDGPGSLTGTLACNCAATQASQVGSYMIVPSGVTSTNYTITFAFGTLSVTKAPLTITATNRTKAFGQTMTFTGSEFSTSGLANSDGVTSVTLSSGGAAGSASPGDYNIVASNALGTGLVNYTISYQNGTLTVNAAASVTLTSIVQISPSYMQIAGAGDTNVVYTIQGSSDLLQWQNLGTATSGSNGTFLFNDGNATNGVYFYRSSLP